MQDLDSPLQPRHELAIVPSPGTKSLCLILKDIDHGINGFGICEPVDDLMAEQVGPCSLLEFVQGSFEEWFQLWRGTDGHGIDGGRWFVCEVIVAVIQRLTMIVHNHEQVTTALPQAAPATNYGHEQGLLVRGSSCSKRSV